MAQCTNDLTPIILAIAAIITVQVPLLVSHFLNASQARHDARTLKTVTYDNNKKLDQIEFITRNGFHSQVGPPGPPGPPGRDVGSENNPENQAQV